MLPERDRLRFQGATGENSLARLLPFSFCLAHRRNSQTGALNFFAVRSGPHSLGLLWAWRLPCVRCLPSNLF